MQKVKENDAIAGTEIERRDKAGPYKKKEK
jgi:hypothetical protein